MTATHQLVFALKSPNRDRVRAYRAGQEAGYQGLRAASSHPDYKAGYRAGREGAAVYLELREAKVREGQAKVDLSRIRLGLR